MRRLALLAIFSLVLAAAGTAAWRYDGGNGSEAAGKAQQADRDSNDLALDPLRIPVLQEGKVTQQLSLNLTLAFADSDVKDKALALMPRLQSALLEELHSLYSLRQVRNAGFDTLLVRERLALASERVLGAGGVAGLTLTVSETPHSGG
jgi:flagellar basal body-associated protein FliL